MTTVQEHIEVPPEWWRSFFQGLVLELWRRAVPAEATRAQADFLDRNLMLARGSEVLDVPCGNGHLSLELAGRGYRLTGVDIAAEFIEEATSRACERGLDIEWKLGEMRDLPWPDRFDGVFCWGNSFGYLDDKGNVEFLEAVCETLRPGGRFILDAAAVAEALFPVLQEEKRYDVGNLAMIKQNHYDPKRGRLDWRYTFLQGGREEVCLGTQRIYTGREVFCLLENAGFTIIAVYGGLDEQPFRIGSHGLIVVSEKSAS